MMMLDEKVWGSLVGEDLAGMWDDKFLLVPVYALVVTAATTFGLPQVVEQSAAFWKPIMIAYNIGMAAFSLACFFGMAHFVLVKQNGEYGSNDCELYSRDELFKNLVYAFYISKYVEFADTLFLMVKKKPVSWLHFYHHCGAAINMGLLYQSKMEAAFLFVGLNSFIHSIMYTYFGAAISGIKLRGKVLITVLQILQFLVGFGLFWNYKTVPCFRDSNSLMFVFWFTYAYVGGVLCFFLNFFVQSYILKSPRRSKAASKKHD